MLVGDGIFGNAYRCFVLVVAVAIAAAVGAAAVSTLHSR